MYRLLTTLLFAVGFAGCAFWANWLAQKHVEKTSVALPLVVGGVVAILGAFFSWGLLGLHIAKRLMTEGGIDGLP